MDIDGWIGGYGIYGIHMYGMHIYDIDMVYIDMYIYVFVHCVYI